MNLGVMKKKNPVSLKPLTEKEIQEKLYGDYHQNRTPLTEDFEEKIAAAPPRPKARPSVIPPRPAPKLHVRIPWQILAGWATKFVSLVWGFFKGLLRLLSTAWGAGLVILVTLFLSIHILNIYRAHAMKQAKPRVRAAVARAVAPAPLLAPPVAAPERVETPLKPLTAETVPAPPAKPKPYVIQVATYSREEDAQKTVGEIKRQKFSAFVQNLSGQSGRTFYAVFLGRFGSFQEAQAKLKEFRENSFGRQFSDSFVRTLTL